MCLVSLTTRFHPAQSRLQSHCTQPQYAGTGWWPRRSPSAPACSAAPAALGLSSAGCLIRARIECIKTRSHILHLSHTGYEQNRMQFLYNHVGFYCISTKHPDSPMRMADSRSLLASGLVSALPALLCPARCDGAAWEGRGGGGGPGGGGTMRGPGGGTGGSW